MKATITFLPGESITWANEAEAQAVSERLGDIVKLEGCTTIFLRAWKCVATFPGNCSPVNGCANVASSPTSRRGGGVHFHGAPGEDAEEEQEEADE
jgi:hypothetical protein